MNEFERFLEENNYKDDLEFQLCDLEMAFDAGKDLRWKPDVDELDALQDMLRYFRIESNAGNREQIADMVESLVEHLKVL